MTTALFANPGQTVRLAVQVLDGYTSDRSDGYVPTVQSVYFPDQSRATGYPQNMSRIETGLYAHDIVLPTGSSALGTFTVSVFYQRPSSGQKVWELFTINVSRPFGNTSASPL